MSLLQAPMSLLQAPMLLLQALVWLFDSHKKREERWLSLI
jgi:hypothetical protein